MEQLGVNSDSVLAIMGGGGLGWYLVNRLRNVLAKDKSEISAYEAMEKTVHALQEENTRLHKTVVELQGEVAKLHVVIAELTNKLTALTISSENQLAIDALAKEGRLERRKDRLPT
jgi:prefoldin subunit 5